MSARPPAQLRIVGTAFLRQRPLVTAPVAAIVYAMFALAGAPRPQLIALAIGLGLLHAMFLAERTLGARRPLSDRTFARSLVVTALGLGVGCAVSGRLASPIVPLLLAPTGIAFAAFGSGRRSAALLALLVVTVVALALVPATTSFPALGAPYLAIAAATTVAGCAVLLRLGVAALADAHASAAAALGRAGDDAAWAAATRAHDLDTLGARVAHEVKNPLAAIRGLVEVMIEGHAETDRDHKRLSVVAGEVARIEDVLREYLERHRPAAALRREPVELGELIRDVVAVLEVRADRGQVAITARGPDLAASVDPRRLKEAILNLALNALDAAAPGDQVALGWRADGTDVVIEIADTGRGMSADDLARIGTPGFTTRDAGTGLGVALARAVVEHHDGTLSFASTPGQGTRVTIRLPRTPPSTPSTPLEAWPRS